jgi:hypothetical protein
MLFPPVAERSSAPEVEGLRLMLILGETDGDNDSLMDGETEGDKLMLTEGLTLTEAMSSL